MVSGIQLIQKRFDAIDNVLDKIECMHNFKVIELTPAIFAYARGCMKKYKLMSNDAVQVATCKVHKIENIATNDNDFERVNFLKVWKP